jgi:hypothetical protein
MVAQGLTELVQSVVSLPDAPFTYRVSAWADGGVNVGVAIGVWVGGSSVSVGVGSGVSVGGGGEVDVAVEVGGLSGVAVDFGMCVAVATLLVGGRSVAFGVETGQGPPPVVGVGREGGEERAIGVGVGGGLSAISSAAFWAWAAFFTRL